MEHEVRVDEEDVVSLVARAHARARFPDLGLVDPGAERVLSRFDLDVTRLDERALRANLLRTLAIDDLVRGFFARHPEGLAVALWPGLCTRFSRVDNGALRWIELAAPALAAFKRTLIRTSDRHVIAAARSDEIGGWMDALNDAADVPTLLVAQGGPLRCDLALRDAFFTRAAASVPRGAEVVIDYDARAPLRPARHEPRAPLELMDADGAFARFPRIRFVALDEEPPALAWRLSDLDAVSRLCRGRLASVAHLRFD